MPRRMTVPWGRRDPLGVPPRELPEVDLMRELEHLHATRHEALRHAPDDALATHSRRTRELEAEYVRRFPRREIDPHRLRPAPGGHVSG